MSVFLASAALDAIRWAVDSHLADGVFVTPAILDTDAFGVAPAAQVESITRVADVPVLVVVGAVAADDLRAQATEFAKVSEEVVVALPFVEDGIAAMTALAGSGVRVAATFVVTPAQAMLAAKVGAVYVCIATDALDAHGHDARVVLRETRALFDRGGIECDVLANVSGGSLSVTEALLAGADGVVVSAETLRAIVQHPLTDRELDQMLGDVSRRSRRPGR